MFSICHQMRNLSLLRLESVNRLCNAGSVAMFHSSCQLERARMMTRIRKRKICMENKRLKEIRLKKNPKPVPQKIILMLKSKGIAYPPKPLRPDESNLTVATDNVYRMFDFCYPRYEVEQAIYDLKCHYHPSFLDRLDDKLIARVELNMERAKKDRYLDAFEKMIPIAHPFDRNYVEKRIFAFVPNDTERDIALSAGAFSTGGEAEIVEMLKGRIDIKEIDRFVCHESMFIKMKTLTGILRDKTPNVKDGTVGSDMSKLVRIFRTGMLAEVKKLEPSLTVAKQPDFGYCEMAIATLSMDINKLKDNLNSLLESLNENKPSKKGFITRVTLMLEDGPHYAKFSIKHPLIHDPVINGNAPEEFDEKEAAEGHES